MAKPPTRIGRLARLGSLTGKVATSYLGQRLRTAMGDEEDEEELLRLHAENAERIVDTVGRLKGAAMKVGQQLALAARALDLPAETAAKLSELNAKGEPIPFATVREDIESSLGRSLEEAFDAFDPTPIGTASLGQAHAARKDGQELVVKVLHRGIEASVDTDLMALKAVLLGSRVLRRDKAEVDAIFDEIRERLHEELDYLQEAANIQLMWELYGADERVRIPRLHAGLCTDRVLVMDRLPGVHLDAFLATGSAAARQRAGLTLAELYYEQAFRHLALHADPHPGNYLFEPDGRVGLLDFGCVKRFDEFFIGTYARAALRGIEGDKRAFLDAIVDLGAWDGTRKETGEILWRFVDTVSEPFRAGTYTIGGNHDSMLERVRPIGMQVARCHDARVPRHVVFLHRTIAGLYAIERQLVVSHNWGSLLRRHAEFAVARASGRS